MIRIVYVCNGDVTSLFRGLVQFCFEPKVLDRVLSDCPVLRAVRACCDGGS